jgi:protein-tyrosine phosphatase
VIRRVPFTGALNFRDIGGYPARGGGVTRWRVVYRSDSLHHLTASDLPVFDALGIKAVYDLRRPGEIARFPGPRGHVHLEIPSRELHNGGATELRTRRDGEEWLLADYLGMLADAATAFGNLFSRLPGTGRLPSVIHCLGGKDRTGLAIALLLSAVGVEREIVLDDYDLTNDCRGVIHVPEVVELFVASGIARQAAEGLLSAPRWAMATTLAALDDTYGGIENYLLGRCQMAPAALDAAKAVLVGQEGTIPIDRSTTTPKRSSPELPSRDHGAN